MTSDNDAPNGAQRTMFGPINFGHAIYESGLPRWLKDIAMCFACCADYRSGGRMFPSVERVAWRLDIKVRQVQRGVSELRKLGVFKVAREARHHMPTEYVLDLAGLPKRDAFCPGSKRAHPRPARHGAYGRTDVDTASSYAVENNPGVIRGVMDATPETGSRDVDVSPGATSATSEVASMSPNRYYGSENKQTLRGHHSDLKRVVPEANLHAIAKVALERSPETPLDEMLRICAAQSWQWDETRARDVLCRQLARRATNQRLKVKQPSPHSRRNTAWDDIVAHLPLKQWDRRMWFGGSELREQQGRRLVIEHDEDKVQWIERHYRVQLVETLRSLNYELEWVVHRTSGTNPAACARRPQEAVTV
jgi:hypothetical protein